jgi:hypothetical protein
VASDLDANVQITVPLVLPSRSQLPSTFNHAEWSGTFPSVMNFPSDFCDTFDVLIKTRIRNREVLKGGSRMFKSFQRAQTTEPTKYGRGSDRFDIPQSIFR